MKTCTGCGQSKPATRQFYHYDNAKRDGFKYKCIVCVAYYMKHDHAPTNKMPRLTTEQLADIEARHEARKLKSRIEQAARNAPCAATGIVMQGVKSVIKIKVCSKCKVQKPATADYFRRRIQNKDGFAGQCKLCLRRIK